MKKQKDSNWSLGLLKQNLIKIFMNIKIKPKKATDSPKYGLLTPYAHPQTVYIQLAHSLDHSTQLIHPTSDLHPQSESTHTQHNLHTPNIISTHPTHNLYTSNT